LDEVRGNMRIKDIVSGDGALIALEQFEDGISFKLYGDPSSNAGYTARIMTELFISHAEGDDNMMLATIKTEGNA
jgi:hypothetical protein